MTNKAKQKTVFTVNSSIALASHWRNAKRGAASFASTFPEAYRKISNASRRRNGLPSQDAIKVANWLIKNS